mgnify:CR=1 FL=1
MIVEISPFYYSDISDYDHTTTSPDTDGDDTAQGPDNNIPVFLMPAEADADNIFVNGRPGTICGNVSDDTGPVSYTHLRAHETVLDLVCRLLLETKKKKQNTHPHFHQSRTALFIQVSILLLP